MGDDLASLGVSMAELRATVGALMPHWRQNSLDDFSYLSGGYSNVNLAFTRTTGDGDARYVLRLPQHTQPYVNRGNEIAWYSQLPQSVGIRPLALNAKTGVMISPWIEGALLVDVFAERFSAEDLLGYLTQMHAALPLVPQSYHVPTLLPEFVDLAELSKPWLRQIIARLLSGEKADKEGDVNVDEVAGDDFGFTLTCHNDLNPWNILVNDAGWVTLDWEFVGRNDALFDLVGLHQGLQLSIDSLPKLAQTYAPEMVSGRLTRSFALFWLREWAWARYQLNQGNRRAEIVEQCEQAEQQLAHLPEF